MKQEDRGSKEEACAENIGDSWKKASLLMVRSYSSKPARCRERGGRGGGDCTDV